MKRCPECGRFVRLTWGVENGYALLMGYCSKDGIWIVLEEIRG